MGANESRVQLLAVVGVALIAIGFAEFYAALTECGNPPVNASCTPTGLGTSSLALLGLGLLLFGAALYFRRRMRNAAR